MNESGIKGSYLGRSTKITGSLVFEGDLRIDGSVSGSVSGGGTGRIFVSEKGRVAGDMRAERIEVRGEVEGKLEADGLFVYAPGMVRGEVSSTSVFVEEGAKIFNTVD